VDRIAELLHDITYVRGLGATLARGIKYASEALGMADQAIHVKGLEPAGYDPRVLRAWDWLMPRVDRGACHLRTTFFRPELSKMIDPEQIEARQKCSLNGKIV